MQPGANNFSRERNYKVLPDNHVFCHFFFKIKQFCGFLFSGLWDRGLIKCQFENRVPLNAVGVGGGGSGGGREGGARPVSHISLRIMNRLNYTESAIFASLVCSLLP